MAEIHPTAIVADGARIGADDEQIGFGGENSVRGFDERTISGDKGLQMNLELWTPPMPELYGVRFLAFFDAAYKVLEKPTIGQRHNDTISSVGVGARF